MTEKNTPLSPEQAEQQLRQDAQQITPAQIDETIVMGERKVERLDANPPARLKVLWARIKLLVRLLKDYSRGRYRDIPWRSIAAVAAALAYFASPIDAVPDFIALLGYSDDAVIISLLLSWINADLERYRRWLETHQEPPPD